jgi:hypothetical protein
MLRIQKERRKQAEPFATVVAGAWQTSSLNDTLHGGRKYRVVIPTKVEGSAVPACITTKTGAPHLAFEMWGLE